MTTSIFNATEISGLADPTYFSSASNKHYIDVISSNIILNTKSSSGTWEYMSSQRVGSNYYYADNTQFFSTSYAGEGVYQYYVNADMANMDVVWSNSVSQYMLYMGGNLPSIGINTSNIGDYTLVVGGSIKSNSLSSQAISGGILLSEELHYSPWGSVSYLGMKFSGGVDDQLTKIGTISNDNPELQMGYFKTPEDDIAIRFYSNQVRFLGTDINSTPNMQVTNGTVSIGPYTFDYHPYTLTVSGSIYGKSVSSQSISGQWTSPLYQSLTDAGDASTRPGQIIRTSGNDNGTWVWISIFGGSTYKWMQLTYLTGV